MTAVEQQLSSMVKMTGWNSCFKDLSINPRYPSRKKNPIALAAVPRLIFLGTILYIEAESEQ